MGFFLVQGDITAMDVDTVVNAANSRLKMGGGVCGAIFSAAGAARLQRACDAIGGCETGGAVITPGFALKARYVIHAVGPVWQGGGRGERAALKSCYESALALAVDKGCASVAFPLISSGIYGYPKREAITVAKETIEEYLASGRGDVSVYLVIYDDATMELARQIMDR